MNPSEAALFLEAGQTQGAPPEIAGFCFHYFLAAAIADEAVRHECPGWHGYVAGFAF